jgi:hypothetical protein
MTSRSVQMWPKNVIVSNSDYEEYSRVCKARTQTP